MRGTGTTTQQIKAAPYGSIYIWCNRNLSYPKNLAANLNRDDLQFESPAYLNSYDKFRGMVLNGIILDHAVQITEEQFDCYLVALTMVRQP